MFLGQNVQKDGAGPAAPGGATPLVPAWPAPAARTARVSGLATPPPSPPPWARGRWRPAWTRGSLVVGLATAVLLGLAAGHPVTMPELLTAPDMTAKKFAGHFADFTYTYREAVQPPEVFLARRDGDCDDYAVVADLVLSKHFLTTRLVHVRLAGLVAHVVCFVVEDKLYLDYNNRIYLVKTEKCSPNLREVAAKVAKSFSANWTSVSEFTWTHGVKHVVRTVAKIDPPSPETDTLKPAPKKD